jgi:hypothetical protein
MFSLINRLIKKRSGISVVEIVIVIAVLVGIALIFRSQIGLFAGRLMNQAFPVNETEIKDLRNVPIDPKDERYEYPERYFHEDDFRIP